MGITNPSHDIGELKVETDGMSSTGETNADVKELLDTNSSEESSEEEEESGEEDTEKLGAGEESATPAKRKKKRKRCALDSCKTKLGLTAYSCRCGRMFCPLHMPAEEHQCDFDYQAEAREQIEEENPKVVAEKVRKL